MTEIKHSTDSSFSSDVSQKDSASLIYFWATWCNPCQIMGPIYEEFSKRASNIHLFKMDVDANQSTAQQFNIMSIPTFLLFKNGEVVGQHVGTMTIDQLQAFTLR